VDRARGEVEGSRLRRRREDAGGELRSGSAPPARVDRDDIFGVRRALAILPEDKWDAFLQRWAQLGDRCEYDLALIRADVAEEADECRDALMAAAWGTVAGAMTSYLAWRSHRS